MGRFPCMLVILTSTVYPLNVQTGRLLPASATQKKKGHQLPLFTRFHPVSTLALHRAPPPERASTRRVISMLPEDPEAFRKISSSSSSTSAAENISNATDLERLSAALDPANGWDYEPEQTLAMRCARAHVGEGPYRLDQARARALTAPHHTQAHPEHPLGSTCWRPSLWVPSTSGVSSSLVSSYSLPQLTTASRLRAGTCKSCGCRWTRSPGSRSR